MILKELNDIVHFPIVNPGIIQTSVGNMDDNVTGIINALDCVDTVEEAVIKKPTSLSVILNLSNASKVVNKEAGKVIRKLIKEDINMIAMHTN